MSADFQSQSQDKWAYRFAFFDAHGLPDTPGFKEAAAKLPWKDRLKVLMNFWAFFFGPIYFIIIGLWKKALVLFGIAVATGFVIGVISSLLGFYSAGLGNGLGVAFGIMYAMIANHAYYLKMVKKQDNWNPFEGVRWF